MASSLAGSHGLFPRRQWFLLPSPPVVPSPLAAGCSGSNPNGEQFTSCKDVSSFFQSYVGISGASKSLTQPEADNQQVHGVGSEEHASFVHKNDDVKRKAIPVQSYPVRLYLLYKRRVLIRGELIICLRFKFSIFLSVTKAS
ncbi:uncharacterized protein LOC127790490 [Diospyros lotus]|uniref:uncharacterized protein LOC127790490 n=1 Tax=Diospyros lotus TaxID=55363 RepID=UPI0022542D5E|nr:uncharacterized protein LOC127790490 [Diospyros lotus]